MVERKETSKRKVPEKVKMSLNFTLTSAQVERCMKDSGKVTVGIKEVGVTKLGQLLEADVIVN